MNKKSKIIVSVVGITIVLLALIGITYAYYLTRIEGNTNTNSISVTTADLRLTYGDGNGEVIANDIMPGTTITKTFTVTNDGDSKVNGYVVVLEGIENDLERTSDLVYTLTCKLNDNTSCGFTEEVVYPYGRDLSVIFTNDIEIEVTHNYTLTVTYKNLTDIDQSQDMGSTINGKINIYDANQINPYSLTDTSKNSTSLTYNIINNAKTNANGTIFRSVPLTIPGKESSSKFLEKGNDPDTYLKQTPDNNDYFVYGDSYQINSNGYFVLSNPQVFQYKGDITLLKGKYIFDYRGYSSLDVANIKAVEGYTNYYLYKVGEDTTATSLSYGDVIKKQESLESTLSITKDNLGTSYYFRGSVQDNYLEFNENCFRIVRIQGDGSIKLIFAGYGACDDVTEDSSLLYSDDDADYIHTTTHVSFIDSHFENSLENWFYDFEHENISKYIKTDKWCLGYNENYIYDYDNGNLLSGITSDYMYENVISFRYATGVRGLNKTLSLLCENENYAELKYGALTIDEAYLAGVANMDNLTYYLYDNAKTKMVFLTLSFLGYIEGDDDYAYGISKKVVSDRCSDDHSWGVRPSITLIPGITIVQGGNGTKINPYVIDTYS